MYGDVFHKKDGLKYPTQYILLGQNYLLKGKFNKAIEAYHKAVRMDPDSAKVRLLLANIWLKKGVNCSDLADKRTTKYLHRAILHYNKAMVLSPDTAISEWAERRVKEARQVLAESERIKMCMEAQKEQCNRNKKDGHNCPKRKNIDK